jgi:hypothetical protein
VVFLVCVCVSFSPWEEKVGTAFFRGTATGGGTKIETNQRLKLASLSHLWCEDMPCVVLWCGGFCCIELDVLKVGHCLCRSQDPFYNGEEDGTNVPYLDAALVSQAVCP